MKDKSSIFASGITLDDSKINDESHDNDDDDEDDHDELNLLKQRCKDKEKNNVADDQIDRNLSHVHADDDDIQEKNCFLATWAKNSISQRPCLWIAAINDIKSKK